MTATATKTTADRQSGEILEIVELAEAPFEMAIREELVAERDRIRHRYGVDNDVAVKLAHERIKSACAAVADDERRILLEGGFRQTRLS